jgi:hypothetical protein
MKRLRTLKLFQIFSTEIKNQKHIAVDVLLKGFPMVPLSCRSNLAGRYTVKKVSGFSRPQPGCHLPNSPWQGNTLIIPAQGEFGQ